MVRFLRVAAINAAQTEFTHLWGAHNVDQLRCSIDEYSPRQPTAKSEKQTEQLMSRRNICVFQMSVLVGTSRA